MTAALGKALRVEDLAPGAEVVLLKPGFKARRLTVADVGTRYVWFFDSMEGGRYDFVLCHRTGLKLERVCDESWEPFEMYAYREA